MRVFKPALKVVLKQPLGEFIIFPCPLYQGLDIAEPTNKKQNRLEPFTSEIYIECCHVKHFTFYQILNTVKHKKNMSLQSWFNGEKTKHDTVLEDNLAVFSVFSCE